MSQKPFLINKARAADLKKIIEIEQTSFQEDAFSVEQFRYFLKSDSAQFYVVCIDDSVIGYIILTTRKNSTNVRVYSIAVAKEMRNAGVGQFLLDFAEKISAASGFTSISLEVSEHNEIAKYVYGKRNYLCTGKKSNYYKDGSNAILMKKNLHG